jgi:hypothetical protein
LIGGAALDDVAEVLLAFARVGERLVPELQRRSGFCCPSLLAGWLVAIRGALILVFVSILNNRILVAPIICTCGLPVGRLLLLLGSGFVRAGCRWFRCGAGWCSSFGD